MSLEERIERLEAEVGIEPEYPDEIDGYDARKLAETPHLAFYEDADGDYWIKHTSGDYILITGDNCGFKEVVGEFVEEIDR